MSQENNNKKPSNNHVYFDSDSDEDKNNKNKTPNRNNRRRQRIESDDDIMEKSPVPIPPEISLLNLITNMNNRVYNPPNSNPNLKKKYICPNPECDHSATSKQSVKPLNIDYVKNISQLIALGKTYHCKKNKIYKNVNLRVLYDLIEPLSELQLMIGLDDVKNKVVDQLLYFLQGYHNNGKKCGLCYDCINEMTCMKNQSDMLHTIVTGKPGVGKTEFAKCIGKIYNKLGILTTDKFKTYTRADLVGEYLGHTAVKTQKCIDACKGGVMFIDEVYSLGNSELRDSFSKECIDTLNLNLSEKRDFLCIIAGYKDAIDNCFFKYNEGLNRRFTFRYDIAPYKANDLKKIFELKVKKGGFEVYYNIKKEDDSENIKIKELFKKNENNFPNCGGDMETLFLKCKIVHSRTISIDVDSKYMLTLNDIEKGMNLLVESRDNSNSNSNSNSPYSSGMMYI
jgi:hypothetical protein